MTKGNLVISRENKYKLLLSQTQWTVRFNKSIYNNASVLPFKKENPPDSKNTKLPVWNRRCLNAKMMTYFEC